MKSTSRYLAAALLGSSGFIWALPTVTAQTPAAAPATPASKPADESVLGEFVVTSTAEEHIPTIAILPSLSPDLEDVIVRSVVRRDLEISGMFKLISDQDAPTGLYGFNDPVDVKTWQSKGAEAIVKVAARKADKADQIDVLGIAYFPSAGAAPVYEVKITVPKTEARSTAHRITDDLLGALTGRPGGFSSHFTFAGAWGRNRRAFSVDADGYGLAARSDVKATALAPTWGPGADLFYVQSSNFSPYRLVHLGPKATEAVRIETQFSRSLYGVAYNKDNTKMALSVSEPDGSAVYVGDVDGKNMKRQSNTEVAIAPVFSPSGKLAWIGGTAEQGGQRVYVDGKAVSPSGFAAYAPTFCDTEDGVFLVYAVMVGDRQDLVMSGEKGGSVQRLTQNQGSNSYPACSSDGRLLAFFSTRKGEPGLYVMSLKRWTTIKVLGTVGEALRWAPIPEAKQPLPSTKKSTKPGGAKADPTPAADKPADAKPADAKPAK